jgi:hypothetical protein
MSDPHPEGMTEKPSMAFKTVIARSEATKQSSVSLLGPGLLRFARNDDKDNQ